MIIGWKPENELVEIVLRIRQYLCNTEFAPEPFTKPVDIDILKVQFPNQIFDCVLNALIEHMIENPPKAMRLGHDAIYLEWLNSLLENLASPQWVMPVNKHHYLCPGCWQSLKSEVEKL